MDWRLCVICQEANQEDLKCPLNSPGGGGDAYKSFLNNVSSFREINTLPVAMDFGDDENVESFTKHRAQWHKVSYEI